MAHQKPIHVLLIEDEAFDVQRIHKTLEPFSERIHIKDIVADGMGAIDLIEARPDFYDVIIMDFQIAGGLRGESLIRKIREIDATLQIIVVTKMTINVTDYDFANRLLDAGAMWYCTKYPGDIENLIYQPTDFVLSIVNAYDKRQLEKRQRQAHSKLEQSVNDILEQKRIIGESDSMRKLRSSIAKYALHSMNVLVSGESGTGKELIASNIHYQSDRRFETFLAVNCGSLPGNLIESELFGFEKGSFTGAGKEKPGFFELADKGTLFLDEISELPMSVQSTLLRVLQEGEIDKIGRKKRIKVDVRIIAATNKDLKKEIKEKRFREDLYYRLNVVSLHAPPLRGREGDIGLLIEHFLSFYSLTLDRSASTMTPDARRALLGYAWPGNVRELQNVVQRLLIISEGTITLDDVNSALGIVSGSREEQEDISFKIPDNALAPLRDMERGFRRQYFLHVRNRVQSDAEAARLLGLAPPNYYRMCKELGLK
ncbi:sigma-54-dependent Fis family transcriptional regulator [bacterium]|nr:sigma-54-dependent Fis family transcriptional regulator [bacterium]